MTTKAAELITYGPSLVMRFIYVMSMALALYVSTQWAFFQVAPMGLWVKYESIKPKEPVIAEKQIIFVTTASIHFTANLRFSDTLFCDFNDGLGMVYTNNYTSERRAIPPRAAIPKSWKFPYVKLSAGDKCQLETVTTLSLPYGIEKQERILGSAFEVQPSRLNP